MRSLWIQWPISRISAIFGSLFQSIMDAQARRNLGAHYTSEENILKLTAAVPRCLWAEFEKIQQAAPLRATPGCARSPSSTLPAAAEW